jgi:hypothetical protein
MNMPNVNVQTEEIQDRFSAIGELRISNRCRTSGAAKQRVTATVIDEQNFWSCLNFEHKFLDKKQ